MIALWLAHERIRALEAEADRERLAAAVRTPTPVAPVPTAALWTRVLRAYRTAAA